MVKQFLKNLIVLPSLYLALNHDSMAQQIVTPDSTTQESVYSYSDPYGLNIMPPDTLPPSMMLSEKLSIGNENYGISPIFGIGAVLKKKSAKYRKLVIPENIRTVPIHPDDINIASSKDNGPISPDTAKYVDYNEVEILNVGLEARLDELRFKVYAGLDVNLGERNPIVAFEMNTRNYYWGEDAQRNFNSSSTYYSLFHPANIRPRLNVEIGAAIPLDYNTIEQLVLSMGTKIKKQAIVLERGWIRNGTTKKMDEFDLGAFENSYYFSLTLTTMDRASYRKNAVGWDFQAVMGIDNYSSEKVNLVLPSDYFVGAGLIIKF